MCIYILYICILYISVHCCYAYSYLFITDASDEFQVLILIIFVMQTFI